MITKADKDYLKRLGLVEGSAQHDVCLERMGTYGNNKWWLSSNPGERAYYQTCIEPVQLLDWGGYGEDLMTMLGRLVLPSELVLDEFKQEVERAWRYGVGCTSIAEATERLNENRERLLQIAIAKASPETLCEARRLAQASCPCPRCVARRAAKYTRKSKKQGKAKKP